MDFEINGAPVRSALAEMRALTAGFRTELTGASDAMRGMDREAKSLARSLGSSLRSAFDKAIFGGAQLGEVFRGLATDVLGKTVDLALRPVQDAVSGGFTSLIGSVIGGVGSVFGLARGGAVEGGQLAHFAHGGVIDTGRVRAFANGGVVDTPTLFPLARGTGLMGEAGPEAILPLSRGADGRLGVTAEGAQRGSTVVNVTIQTADVDSFRRSRGQVAAELARAVGRGSQRL